MDLFGNLSITAVQFIQLMLAPGVMINACGLLLLGINNKYSTVVNRIRLLNEEKRRLMIKIGEQVPSTDENVRLASIAKQVNELTFRARLVRNAVLSFTMAVGLFVTTSLLLGFSALFSITKMNSVVIVIFLLGMCAVFIGVLFAGWEAKKGYEIITFEVKADE